MNISGTLTHVLPIEEQSQVGYARRTTQKLAQEHGFDETDAGRVALITTELASNLLKHAGHGALHLRVIPRAPGFGIEIVAVDRGPGFDEQTALADGFSTSGTQGIGLGAISRMTDVFDVYTDSNGSVVLARLYPRGGSTADLAFGVSQHSLHDDPACGDTWHLALHAQGFDALIIDGLGHGIEAEQAARAGEAVFAKASCSAPAILMDDLHHAMLGTRGGAVGFAQYRAAEQGGLLTFTGIGNISACLVNVERSRGFASHPGIVGVQYRKAKAFDYPHAQGHLLIMHSDGLQTRWNLQNYPGLVHRHPAVIATVLHRDFCRGRDDVTVLVAALESGHE